MCTSVTLTNIRVSILRQSKHDLLLPFVFLSSAKVQRSIAHKWSHNRLSNYRLMLFILLLPKKFIVAGLVVKHMFLSNKVLSLNNSLARYTGCQIALYIGKQRSQKSSLHYVQGCLCKTSFTQYLSHRKKSHRLSMLMDC